MLFQWNVLVDNGRGKKFEPEVQAVFLLPGDNPHVKPQTILELIKFYKESKAGIIYPCFKGLRGHPPLISARYIKSILAWNQPGGLRVLLSNYAMDALKVEVADQGVVLDMDNPTDRRCWKTAPIREKSNIAHHLFPGWIEYYRERELDFGLSFITLILRLERAEQIFRNG